MGPQTVPYVFFIAVTLAAYWWWAECRRARLVVLLVASYFFYVTWIPIHLSLLLFSTALDYSCGRAIFAAESRRRKRFFICLSLAGNLGVLAYFKYIDWGIDSLNLALASLGVDAGMARLEVLAPIGISFYTFQTLSYTLDIYRGYLRPARSLLDFAVFVSFFPQLIAGPIVRAREFLPQLERDPPIDRARFSEGCWRIGCGLTKKLLLADMLGLLIVDPVFAAPEGYAWGVRVLAYFSFTLQVYYDFSGYSDIAIGVAGLLGLQLPENFNRPFRSRSVGEFWRRWHMTLGTWVRDYVLASMLRGRGARTETRIACSMIVSMIAIGVWHGPGILWVVYGLSQGLALVVERYFTLRRRRAKRARSPISSFFGWFFTVNYIVLVTASCARPASLDELLRFLEPAGTEATLSSGALIVFVAAVLLQALSARAVELSQALARALPRWGQGVALGGLSAAGALLSIGQTPFIYFRF